MPDPWMESRAWKEIRDYARAFKRSWSEAWRDGRNLTLVLLTATIAGVVMACVGLVCGVLYSVGGFFVDLFTIGLNFGTVLAFGALIGMPVIFGIFGLFCGALIALLGIGARAVLRRPPSPSA